MSADAGPVSAGRRTLAARVGGERRADAIAAVSAMALSLLAVFFVWQLWRAHMRVPLFAAKGDAAWTLSTVKGILRHGWYESNPELGAPFGQLNYDFPAYAGELGKVLMVEVLGLVLSNPVVVVNLLLIVGFPLIALVTFVVLRMLGLSRAVAVVCSVLFAASPIHFYLAPVQAWIALYAGVPLSGFLILATLGHADLFRRRVRPGAAWAAWISPRSATTIVMCLLVGCLGLTYAEFTCVIVGIAGVLTFALRRRLGPLISAVVVIVAIAVPVLGSAAPDLAYRSDHGINQIVARRVPVEAFKYGLQPIQLFLPQRDDRVPVIGRLTERIDDDLEQGYPNIPINLGGQTSLGLVSAIGLLWLLWVVIGGALGRVEDDSLARRAGVAALLTVLVTMTAGGSVLVAYLVTATLQVWVRASILIGFFAIVGVGLLLERLQRALERRARGLAASGVALLAVLAFGVFEGTTRRFVPEYDALANSWTEEARFVAQVQHSLPSGAMVLELPYVPYPEAQLPTGFTSYEPLVPYLHSTTLRWSGGAMEGRATDWLARASALPTDQLIRGAVAAGFRGVYILRAGYADGGVAEVAAVQALVGEPPIEGAAGSAAFFDVQRYAARLARSLSPAALRRLARASVYSQPPPSGISPE
ncbi:MAG: hypothetical protein ACHQHO_02400 [Solirubrobacterales bacterium]